MTYQQCLRNTSYNGLFIITQICLVELQNGLVGQSGGAVDNSCINGGIEKSLVDLIEGVKIRPLRHRIWTATISNHLYLMSWPSQLLSGKLQPSQNLVFFTVAYFPKPQQLSMSRGRNNLGHLLQSHSPRRPAFFKAARLIFRRLFYLIKIRNSNVHTAFSFSPVNLKSSGLGGVLVTPVDALKR
jgi:hypothetical protein